MDFTNECVAVDIVTKSSIEPLKLNTTDSAVLNHIYNTIDYYLKYGDVLVCYFEDYSVSVSSAHEMYYNVTIRTAVHQAITNIRNDIDDSYDEELIEKLEYIMDMFKKK
jgi:hypothetical protein